jgi:hypothetical protein
MELVHVPSLRGWASKPALAIGIGLALAPFIQVKINIIPMRSTTKYLSTLIHLLSLEFELIL